MCAKGKDLNDVGNNLIDKYSKNRSGNGGVSSAAANALINNIISGMKITNIPIANLIESPSDWNIFPKYSKEEMSDLIDSILDIGLLNPIIVWEQESTSNVPTDKKYFILAGHNRVEAYRLLSNNYEGGDKQKYLNIPAYVKEFKDINETEARQIIIDTNIVQRENKQSVLIRAISEKYRLLGRAKRHSGENNSAKIAREYNIDRATVFNYCRVSKLIPELVTMLDTKKLSLKNCIKLSELNEEDQMKLYLENESLLDNKLLNKVKPAHFKDSKIDELIKILSEYEPKDELSSFLFKVPNSFKEEFKKYVEKFFDEKGIKKV